jgi:glycosyltransferase involved in cell wall biosynthesis
MTVTAGAKIMTEQERDTSERDEKRPAISVLTPAYNEESHILDCMASVQSQSMADFEHIIVDDQSSDDTYAIAKRHADSRTMVLENPTKGKLAALKHAYNNSSGRFIVLLAGDDLLPPDSLEKRFGCMEGVDALHDLAVARGHLKSFSQDPHFDGLMIPKHKRGYFSGGVIIMSRAFADKAFDVPDSLPNEDTWIRLCAEHLGATLVDSPGVSLLYRIHSENTSASRGDFKTAVSGYSKRERVAEVFLEKYEAAISDDSKSRIKSKLDLEEARANGTLLDVLTVKGVSMTEKLRALVFRYQLAYKARNKLWRYIVGWR